MLENYILKYRELTIDSKREYLLKEVRELLDKLEDICLKKNIDINTLKSSTLINNKDILFEEDYYDLLFIYILYIKEDIAQIL